MKTDLILVVTSPDRPGIVEEITAAVVARGGNWEESRFARLCGDFAGIARVSVEAAQAEELMSSLSGMTTGGLKINAREASPATKSQAATSPHRVQSRLVCSGADNEGIVNSVSRFLSVRGVNVEEMNTSVSPAPTTGTPVFTMECNVAIPSEKLSGEIRSHLSELSNQLAVDIQLDGEDLA